MCFYLIRIVFKGFDKLEIRKSTRKGYHCFIWTNCKGKKTELREYFGDDKKHLAMDKLHRYAKQTNFNKKRRLK